MDQLRQYAIAFAGLKEGVHHFVFDIDDKFFALFENSLVKRGKLKVLLHFEKSISFFLLRFDISGSVLLGCDRCAADLNYPLASENQIVVKFDEHNDAEKDDSMADVIYISRTDSHLDVSQLIYEFINLAIPFNHVNCDNLKGKKPCDQDILQKLSNPVEKNQNVKDSRWDNLSKIKFS